MMLLMMKMSFWERIKTKCKLIRWKLGWKGDGGDCRRFIPKFDQHTYIHTINAADETWQTFRQLKDGPRQGNGISAVPRRDLSAYQPYAAALTLRAAGPTLLHNPHSGKLSAIHPLSGRTEVPPPLRHLAIRNRAASRLLTLSCISVWFRRFCHLVPAE